MEKNIEIISSSNIDKNYIILASHSGTNTNAYFNNLHLLNINDLIYIHHQNKEYTYEINKIYYIEKTGYLEIPIYLEDTLILITCSLEHKNKQLIVSSKLINIKNN